MPERADPTDTRTRAGHCAPACLVPLVSSRALARRPASPARRRGAPPRPLRPGRPGARARPDERCALRRPEQGGGAARNTTRPRRGRAGAAGAGIAYVTVLYGKWPRRPRALSLRGWHAGDRARPDALGCPETRQNLTCVPARAGGREVVGGLIRCSDCSMSCHPCEDRANRGDSRAMDEIAVGNFRCFGEVQRARLAPLTLLVGENSAGKTSFMALARALWEMTHQNRVPDFKEVPYDLGSFDEIVHHRGAKGGRAQEFYAGFRVVPGRRGRNGRRAVGRHDRLFFAATFRKRGTGPFPVRIKVTKGSTWIEDRYDGEELRQSFGTDRGGLGNCKGSLVSMVVQGAAAGDTAILYGIRLDGSSWAGGAM